MHTSVLEAELSVTRRVSFDTTLPATLAPSGTKTSKLTRTLGGTCVLLSLLTMTACSRRWSEVSEVPAKAPSGRAIRAGSTFRIEPVQFTPAQFAGKEFTENKFAFRCRSLQKGVVSEYIGTSMLVMKGVTETQPGTIEKWATGDDAKEISLRWMVIPEIGAYHGGGSLYFYLSDKDKNCISNIVAWPVAFR